MTEGTRSYEETEKSFLSVERKEASRLSRLPFYSRVRDIRPVTAWLSRDPRVRTVPQSSDWCNAGYTSYVFSAGEDFRLQQQET